MSQLGEIVFSWHGLQWFNNTLDLSYTPCGHKMDDQICILSPGYFLLGYIYEYSNFFFSASIMVIFILKLDFRHLKGEK